LAETLAGLRGRVAGRRQRRSLVHVAREKGRGEGPLRNRAVVCALHPRLVEEARGVPALAVVERRFAGEEHAVGRKSRGEFGGLAAATRGARSCAGASGQQDKRGDGGEALETHAPQLAT